MIIIITIRRSSSSSPAALLIENSAYNFKFELNDKLELEMKSVLVSMMIDMNLQGFQGYCVQSEREIARDLCLKSGVQEELLVYSSLGTGKLINFTLLL